MSVLAHLVASRGEPGVTQALAYILNQQPDIVQAFVNLLGAADIRFKPRHRVESERGDDGQRIPGRPDMKIYDSRGQLRVLVENKFWAGLTNSQPVDYLKMLPECMSSGLLFVVPGDHVGHIWSILKDAMPQRGPCSGAGVTRGRPGEVGLGGNPTRRCWLRTGRTFSTHWKGLPMEKKSSVTSASFDNWWRNWRIWRPSACCVPMRSRTRKSRNASSTTSSC